MKRQFGLRALVLYQLLLRVLHCLGARTGCAWPVMLARRLKERDNVFCTEKRHLCDVKCVVRVFSCSIGEHVLSWVGFSSDIICVVPASRSSLARGALLAMSGAAKHRPNVGDLQLTRLTKRMGRPRRQFA
eukprot:3345857-Amphidinium_carterae.1